VEESDDMWIDRAICEFADRVGQEMILNPGARPGVVSVIEMFRQLLRKVNLRGFCSICVSLRDTPFNYHLVQY